MENQNNIVEIENLVKRYGDQVALDHLNLEVREGEIFGLLGPNESGKTTALNCLLALLKFDKGQIRIFGKEMRQDAYEIKKKIGVVMQNVAVFDQMTVQENVDYFCGLYVSEKKRRKELVEEALAFTGLENFRKKRPKQLSGGLLRRLNVACGIAHKPKLLIMDEPTVAVDPQSRNKILEGIEELNRQGTTVIYTSHYMEEVEQICQRIMIIDHGRALATGTSEELKRSIKTGETITIEGILLTEEQMNLEGIVYGNETLTVSKNSISSSILETVLNSYVRNASMLKEIASAHPERMEDAVEAVSGYQEMIKKVTPDGKTTDTSYSYFFALLAMTCLYGCFPGLQTMMETQANITALGARQCITPVHKSKRILVSASVTYVVQFVNTVLVLLFLRYILRLKFAGSMAGMLLICLFGSMIGVSFGIVIGALGKMEEGAKVGILIGVSMLLCFFAGLMSPDVKSMAAEKAPIFNNLNPAAVISDAFYCLNVYNDGARLTRCLATLGGNEHSAAFCRIYDGQEGTL